MSAIGALIAAAIVPWAVVRIAGALCRALRRGPTGRRQRAATRLRRITLVASALIVAVIALLGSWSLSATTQDPQGAIMLAAFSVLVAWTALVSMAVGWTRLDDASDRPFWSIVRWAFKWQLWVFVPVIAALGPSLVIDALPARAAVVGVCGWLGVAWLCPWLFAHLHPVQLEDSKRLVSITTVDRSLVHLAFIPWLRLLFVTESAHNRLDRNALGALIDYECFTQRRQPLRRWALASVAIGILFGGASLLSNPLLRTTALIGAAMLSLFIGWRANRVTLSQAQIGQLMLKLTPGDLAAALHSLQAERGQWITPTSHHPIAPQLYARLVALGHDPGPAPSRP